MKDQNKNLIPAFIISALLLMAWQFFYIGPKQRAEKAMQLEQQQKAVAEAVVEQSAEDKAPEVKIISRQAALDRDQRLKIDGARISGSINLEGGKFDDIVLKDYKVSLDDNSPNVDILDPIHTEKQYFAEFGWITQQGKELVDTNATWQSSAPTLQTGETVTLSRTEGDLLFEKVISLDDKYLFTVTQRVTNKSGQEVSLRPFGLISRRGTPEVKVGVVHQGPIGVLGGKLHELKYKNLQEERESFDSQGGWLGITDKYWLISLIPDQSEHLKTNFTYQPKSEQYQVDYTSDTVYTIPAGQSVEVTNHLFTGAKELKTIEYYADRLNVDRFNRAIDFGWYYFLTWPMYSALDFIASQTGSFAISLLVMTVLIKLVFFPLANKSYTSMSKMKKLTPQLNEIKEKFDGDSKRIQQEVMALYAREKVNPLSGCLPILVQIPIFFSLYKVFSIAIEMRHAPFWGWVQDMSAPDPTTFWNLFGLINWDPHAYLPSVIVIGAWPLMMAATMYLQQKLNPAPTDPSQAMMMKAMPLFMLFVLGGFPAGLVIYWTWSNLLSILQQYIIMKRMGVSIDEGESHPEKKKEKA